ncbi:MAG TPA: protein kinase [Planctomycetota bacterium]|nr:protein kinase [Planctomycetota bacterium]
MAKAPIRELLFGRLALAEKLVTDEQLTECLGLQIRYGEYGGKVPLLGEMLIMKGYLSAEQVRAILDGQRSRRDGLFGEIAMRWRLIDAAGLERALEAQRGMDAAGKPRAGLGEILVDLGLLRPSQVRVVLGAQGKRIVGCSGCKSHFNVVRFRAGVRLACPRCNAAIALDEAAAGPAENAPLGVVGTLWCPPDDGAALTPPRLLAPARRRPTTVHAEPVAAPPAAPAPAPAQDRPKAAAAKAPAGAAGAAGEEDLVEIREDAAGGYYYVDPAKSADQGEPLRIGGYEIVSRLGSDAVSAVCKARRLPGGEMVALKVLRPDGTPDGKMARAFREAGKKAVYLVHANLKRVFEIGVDRGRIFLAEEFVEGQSLKRHLELVGRMLASDAIDVARQLAEALRYGHERGVVHGDVRPSNVIIDERGAARLSGLGVPKDAVLNLRYLGREAVNIPFYLAPEVAVDPARADARSDVYSLGAVLYHMLTGRPPYSGSGTAEVLMRLARESLVPPEQIDPKLPRGLCALVCAMLAPEPDERPASMADVGARLKSLAGGLSPIRIAPPSAVPAAGKAGAVDEVEVIEEVDGDAPTQSSSPAKPAGRRPKARAVIRTGKYRRRRSFGR